MLFVESRNEVFGLKELKSIGSRGKQTLRVCLEVSQDRIETEYDMKQKRDRI